MNRLLSILTLCAAVAFAGCKKNNGGDDVPTLYTITVTSGGNGSAEADMEEAAEGATVKLTATADPYCEFVKWIVESGGVTIPATNPATFTMPAGDVSVKAEFIEGVRINGVIWALYNVDAPGTFTANPEDYGMFYQWNRKTGWSSADPLMSSPAGAAWDNTPAEGEEWEAANDPCPAGWRVPTHDEQVALCDAEKTTNEWTTLNNVNGREYTDKDSPGNSIFLPAAGTRNSDSQVLIYVGSHGYYWSATIYGNTTSYRMNINSEAINLNSEVSRFSRHSVRCVWR